MAERTLKKRRPAHLPVVLLRPSIIIGSLKEPFPGWIDTLSAAGGLSFAAGIGILKYVHGDPDSIADLIPVDFVCNQIIVATALNANKPGLQVIHSTTSHTRPLTWQVFSDTSINYLKR